MKIIQALMITCLYVGCLFVSCGRQLTVDETFQPSASPTEGRPPNHTALPVAPPQPTATEEIYPALTRTPPEVVLIPAGRFVMGSFPEAGLEICQVSRPGCTLDEFLDEGPVHEVFLDNYWIDIFEVTNEDYRGCVDAGACDSPSIQEFYANLQFNRHPVVFVNWFQAERYCQWAGGDLPTEAQWEKAARGIDERLFPWGDETECGYANLKGCTEGLTMDIGSFPEGASAYGVMDLAGNASEWVRDWYSENYYATSPGENPGGPAISEMKVARGGSWKNPFAGVRTTRRAANFPEVYSSGAGFRCAYSSQP